MSNEKENNSSFVCKSCGAKLNVDPSQVMAICDYCGSSMLVSELINESDDVKIQKIKSQAYKDVEMGKQQLEAERIKSEAEKEKRQADENSVEKFKKSKFSKVLIIFAVVSALFCAVAFNDGKILAGFIGIIQTALFVVAYLMGIQVIKEKKRNLRTLVTIIAFVLLIPFLSLYSVDVDKAVDIEWSDIVLGDVIPQPESNRGEITFNSESELYISIHNMSQSQYNDYVSACKEKGFTIDIDESSISFSAYNQDGYKLSLTYFESDSEMSIDLDPPMEMGEIQWPNSDIAKLLPTPSSNIGNISWENSGGFVIYIGNTTKAEYNQYVNACSAKGFNVDYNKGDDYYYADNADGYHVSLRYEGNNIMCVQIEDPKDKTDSGNSSNNTTTDKYSNLKSFIDKYNKIAKTDITNPLEIDIQSPEYYRTEFRLGAFQNAPAYKGSIGNNYIEIINSNYDGVFGSDLRIYAFVDTLAEATDIFESFCKACDSDITQEDFDEFYKYDSLDSEYGCSIVIGNISGYVHIKADGFDIMLDADPDYFN